MVKEKIEENKFDQVIDYVKPLAIYFSIQLLL